jgi:acetolactate synthase-1/2/3 large subunit
MNLKITGAEALIKALICEGVDRVFGYPGGAIIPVYDRLYDYSDKIRHILTRHEQGAIHAAQGYARATGQTGVVIATSGPGATNLITGLSDAMMDSTPLVVITGQVSAKFLGSDAFQETDVVGITQPITKWALQIRRPEDLTAAIAKAFYIARSGRPGPVVLDIAKDAQIGTTDWRYRPCTFIRSYDPVPEISADSLKHAADIINSAQRPMIISGHGVMISNAEEWLRQLAEKADIPVASTLLGLSTMPSSHPLFKGMLGMHGNIGPNVNTNRCDVLIAIGMRFDDRVTGDTATYAPQAKIIHIDIDPSEFNKNVRATVTVNGDATTVLQQLIPMVNETRHDGWAESFDKYNRIEHERIINDEIHPASDRKMTMGEVINLVSEAAGNDAILVTDVGQNQMMSARYFRFSSPRSIITSGGLGTMGFGLPAAIGAKMGCPDRTVCLFCGDGGFQMTIQELGTIMENGTAVKIIILNNSYLGNVRQWQQLFYNNRYSSTPLLNPDFTAIAGAYGIQSEKVSSRHTLASAIDRMMAHDGPFLLDVDIDSAGNVFPMTPAMASVDQIMLTPDEMLDING